MTSSGHLDITVIYAEDGRVSPQVRRTTTSRAVNSSRLAACLVLSASASWMFVVWFPLHAYLHTCLFLKAPFMLPANLDLNRLLFGGPPPADLAVPGSASSVQPEQVPDQETAEDDISAYRSRPEESGQASAPLGDSAGRRKHLVEVAYYWLGLMTVAGSALALAGGTRAAGWVTASDALRPARLVAAILLLITAYITFRYWPRAGSAAQMPPSMQVMFCAGFALSGAVLIITSTRSVAGGILALGLLLFAGGTWLVWTRYQRAFPEIALRAAAMSLMVLAGLLGATLAGRARSAHHLAMGLVVLAWMATIGGLAYGHQIGGFTDFTPSAETYMKATGLHALALLPLLWGRLAAR